MTPDTVLAAVFNATATSSTVNATARLDPAVPSTNSTAPQPLIPAMQGWVSSFATNATAFTTTLDKAVIDIAGAAVIFLVITGVFLWFSRINRRLGKDLLEGGILIGLFLEFGVPFLLSLHLP